MEQAPIPEDIWAQQQFLVMRVKQGTEVGCLRKCRPWKMGLKDTVNQHLETLFVAMYCSEQIQQSPTVVTISGETAQEDLEPALRRAVAEKMMEFQRKDIRIV